MARPRTFQHPRGPRRATSWGIGPKSTPLVFTASEKLLWTNGVTAVGGSAYTLIRTRGYVAAYLTVAGAIGAGFRGAHGILMVSEEAFTAGVASLPGPLTDSFSEQWLWHSYFDCHAITATIADGSNAVSHVQRIEIDSKAMRKGFDNARIICGVTEVVEVSTATLQVHADSRLLLKQ